MKHVPAYLRIEQYLRSLIESGEGRASALPTEPELAAKFRVSRMTARAAFGRLVNSGLVVRYPKHGSFATGPVLEELPMTGSAVSIGDGRAYSKRTLRYEVRPASFAVAQRFGIARGTEVTYLHQIRLIDGSPAGVDVRYMPAAAHATIPAADIERGHLVTLLPANGFPIAASLIEVNARAATTAQARALGITPGSPILERHVSFSDARERLVAFGTSIYPADRYTYRVRVSNLR